PTSPPYPPPLAPLPAGSLAYPHPHSFPTRRSSDLSNLCGRWSRQWETELLLRQNWSATLPPCRKRPGFIQSSHRQFLLESHRTLDRKSTRLNSSHVSISYAVFCLKKKRHANSMYKL